MNYFVTNSKIVLFFICLLICSCSKDLSFEQSDKLLNEKQKDYNFQYYRYQDEKSGALQINYDNLSVFNHKFASTRKYISFLSVVSDKNVANIPYFDNLEQLEISSRIYEKKFFPIINLGLLNNNLISLSIYNMKISNINDLSHFKNLRKLVIENCDYDEKINYENLPSLVYLEITDDDRVDFMEFQSIPNLKYLTIRNCKNICNLEFVEYLNLDVLCFDENFYNAHIVYINSLKKKNPNMKVFNGIQ